MFCFNVVNSLFRRTSSLAVILLSAALSNAFAQADIADTTKVAPKGPWIFDGTFVFNINQSSFTNWVSGGENQVGLTTIVKPVVFFDNNRWSWSFSGDMRYGLQKVSSDKARKSDDVFKLEIRAGRRISKKWKFSGLYLFNTQISPSYDIDNINRLLSKFMAPAYTNLSLGFEYVPDDHLSIYVTPTNFRSTYVLNDSLSAAGEFGVKPGNPVLFKFGPSAYITYKNEVLKNILVDTKFGFFQNILDGLGDPVINWDALVTMKINEHMATSFTFTLLYDPDSKGDTKDSDGNLTGKVAKVQFKQTLGVGFNLNW